MTLTDIEAEHGFVFGDDGTTTGKAPLKATLLCSNPTCDNAKHHVAIHDDTVLPVFCGSCGQLVYCEHLAGDPHLEHGGTHAAPWEATVTACTLCNTELSREQRDLEPIKFGQVPVQDLGKILS